MKIQRGRKETIAIIVMVLIGAGSYLLYSGLSAKQRQEQKKLNLTESGIISTSTKEEPIKIEEFSYSITGVPVSISKETGPFNFTAEQLKSGAEECGTKHETGYFDKLVAKFSGTSKVIYNFKYKGDSQDDGVFTVTLLPNKAGYVSLDQFKKDFAQCYVAGNAYPLLFNGSWLLFVNSCGSGFDDGSGHPHGCDEVEKVVEPSLKLN